VERLDVRQIRRAVVAFGCVLVVGTIGFELMLGEGWSSSFYRAVVTTTLTGLDSKPEGTDAELFSVALLFSGVAIFLYLAGAIVELITRGVLGGSFSDRRRRRTIDQLRDHVIICGFGRVGRSVAAEVAAAGVPHVVVDVNEESVRAAREAGTLVVHGDGTEDADLEQAGLRHARALAACADSDETNLFITLSARAARSDLVVIARASDQSAASKLRLAGATRVVEPYSNAGRQIASRVLKPQVAAFLDVVSTAGGPELRLEEIEVVPACPAAGKSIRDLAVRDATGAIIIAVRKADGSLVASPEPGTLLDVGDVLIGVGSPDQIERLESLFSTSGAVVG
jgi:voltage-gated potassium channel